MIATTNLTGAQALIWTGQKLNPDLPLYNMVRTFTLDGPLDIELFMAAFRRVVHQSDALRSVIVEDDGSPVCRVLKLEELEPVIEFLDFSTAPDPAGRFDRWLSRRSRQALVMDRSLFDAAVVRLAPARHVWYLNQHHIITDAWSARLVYDYVGETYAALRDDAGNQLAPLPSFAEAIEAGHGSLSSAADAQADEFWREKCSPPLPATNFYGRTVTGAAPASRRIHLPLGPARSNALKALADSASFRAPIGDMSLFTVFATAYFIYLHKITGETSLGFGTPFHNRMTPLQKKTIGPFLHLYLLRVEIDEDETVQSLAAKVRNELFASLRHAGRYPDDDEHARAFDVVLNFLTVAYDDFAGLAADPHLHHPGCHDGNHLLRLHVNDWTGSGALDLDFDFNDALFDGSRRDLAMRHVVQVLDALIAEPSQRLDRLSLLTEAEWQRNVVAFNQTATGYDRPPVIHLFEARAAETPDAVALRIGAQTLTYAELNRRANQLAHSLRGRNVGRGALVGLCIRRSAEAVIGMLATLKAGAAYVPLDPSYPQERLAFMLEDSGVALVLTQATLVESLPTHHAEIFCLDRDWSDLQDQSPENPATAIEAEQLAYVIYTSGSTGMPKGAMVSHRGLSNYITWAKREYVGEEQLSFPLFTSFSFDLTVTSIYTPLVSGGSIVVYPEQGLNDAPILFDVIADNQVDVMKLTPAHLTLAKDLDFSETRLRTLILGGEDLKRSLAAEFTAKTGGAIAVYNEYGPTEATVGCMIHKFDPAADLADSVPIGRPIANNAIYLLDHTLQPVATGVVGEICIGGAGVGSGYLNRPDLTAERFVPDPFTAGGTLYRTGDIGRWTEDGALVFLGRRDHQVKITGARIELGEIEARLREHPGIRDAVVSVTDAAHASAAEEVDNCVLCGLPANFPDVDFDEQGVCTLCRDFERFRDDVFRYFRSPAELDAIAARAKAERTGDYDCMLLYSGGKDSSYVLTRLVDMGLTVLAFSLDNGYISDEAKENMRRITDHLGVDLVFGATPHMNAIFADSLQRFSNVCQGCYKTIYTLSMNLAREKGITTIFTGLSRGQLFETRLDELFRNRIFDVNEMDAAVLEARKVYHRMDDAVHRLLDVSLFADDKVFDEIRFVDFFRYTDIELDEIYDLLATRVPWARPQDTGRSTNCLINEAGIFVHQREQGYHNYALPYSWDVRLGHKTREEALDELNDDLRMPMINRMLDDVGYMVKAGATEPGERRLAAYYVREPDGAGLDDLRGYLAESLPVHMLPTYFVELEELPLTPNGKIDRAALPDPTGDHLGGQHVYVPPETDAEQELAAIWARTLGDIRIGIHDNFFALGGASIPAVQVVARISELFAVDFSVSTFFAHPTIAEQAEILEDLLIAQLEALSDEEADALLLELDA